MAEIKAWQVATFFVIVVLLILTVVSLFFLQVTTSVSNYFELLYAQATQQFLPKIQIGYFINAFFPINNKVTLATYANVINGTASPQLASVTRYIASTGITAYPLTTATPIVGTTLLTPYTISLNPLIYANNPNNIPNGNHTFYYVYPIYLVSYTVSCPALNSYQEAQITSITSPMLKYFGTVCSQNSNSITFNYQALLGIDNKTSTQIDQIYTSMNPQYLIGTQNFLQPLSIYNVNGTVATVNNAINGTLMGYVTSLNSTFIITKNGEQKSINPIRNIIKGNAYNGRVMLADLYCWNSPSLTNYFTTAGYSQYTQLYLYKNSTSYQCLTVNATDTMLNATSNIDGTNFRITPYTPGLSFVGTNTILTTYPYILATKVAVADDYQYITKGEATSISQPIIKNGIWFLPNNTDIFSLTNAPNYVFSEFSATQYLMSVTLPILGQEPNYTIIPIQSLYSSTPISQQAVISNVSTYLYAPLLQNITYQYIFNTSKNGTPVACNKICEWNGTLVYSEASSGAFYPYQKANPNFGYLELPLLNETVYYNPEIAIVAETPFINDTNSNNYTYAQLCLVINAYVCQYGAGQKTIPASEAFADAKNYSAFVIYGEGVNSTFIVNSYQITGWNKMETYLNTILPLNKMVTITALTPSGTQRWVVAGVVENVTKDEIVIAPQNFQINAGAYPQARPLTYSTIEIIVFCVSLVVVCIIGYIVASIRTQAIFGERENKGKGG